ncbi:25647_t:CDS:1, partial [Gigaspora margarita]
MNSEIKNIVSGEKGSSEEFEIECKRPCLNNQSTTNSSSSSLYLDIMSRYSINEVIQMHV